MFLFAQGYSDSCPTTFVNKFYSRSTMPKSNISASRRIREFPNQGFVNQNGKLFCSACAIMLDYEKKSTLSDHCKTAKHQKLQKASISTPDISEAFFPPENLIDQQWTEMVEAFVAAGIPLNVFGNEMLRNWMTKYVKNGTHLPCTSTLRKKVDKLADMDKEATVALCRNQDVCVIADETIDIKARKVLNILMKPLGSDEKSRLVSTTILKKVDADEIVHHVTKTVTSLGLDLNAIVIFCSDNAPYMLKAGVKLSAVCPRIIHTTCWSHVLHLVSEEIREQMTDKLIALIKRALNKSPARKLEFLECMAKYEQTPKLPPVPVITRWTTWLETASFHWSQFKGIKDWVTQTTDDSPTMKQLKLLFKSQEEPLAQQLERIHQSYPGLSTAITQLEGQSVCASGVWSLLELVHRYLVFLGIPSDKLHLYMKRKHPAIEFWQSVPMLDPRKCPETLHITGLPSVLAKFSKTEVPISEIFKYQQLSSEEIKRSSNFQVKIFWRKYAREIPHLSKLALRAISVPPSSADVERSFSYLKRILAPQRTSFTEKNLEAHLRITFNSTKITLEKDDDLIDIEIV